MEILSSKSCDFELDARGFVRATMHQGTVMDKQEALENLHVTARLTGGRRMPVLVDSRGLKYQTKEAREVFVSPEASEVSTAVALFVGSPVSRMIGNFFLRQTTHRTPTRLFTDETAAIAWLLEQPR